MTIQKFDPKLIYKQLEHLEKEIQIIKQELTQGTIPELDSTWDALQEAKGLWEREWDVEWKELWEKS